MPRIDPNPPLLCPACGEHLLAGHIHACPYTMPVEGPALGPKSTKILDAIEAMDLKLGLVALSLEALEAKLAAIDAQLQVLTFGLTTVKPPQD